MRRIRTVVIDDEPLARRGIHARLAARAEYEIVADAGDAERGGEEIRRHRPDLVFLDIEMPGADGFSMIEQLPEEPRPLVIFVTAHDDRALDAFQVQAFDYLLKPIDDERFSLTLDRVEARLAERRPRRAQRLCVRVRGQLVPLDPATIDWVQSDGDYVRIHAGRSNYLHHATLTSMTATLPAEQFVRVHRTAIVNVERVQSMERLTNGDHEIRLTTGVRVRVSRTNRDALLVRLGQRQR